MSKIDERALQAAVQVLLANAQQGIGLKDVPSSTPTIYWAHGNGGLFSAPGLGQQLFNAMGLPITGLQSKLPVSPNNDTHPLYGIITGVTATSGSEPTGVCDDPPVAGLLKLCTHTAPFGRQSRMTRVLDITRAGQRTNRGEFTDFLVVGGPETGNPNMPTLPVGADLQAATRNEVMRPLFELGVAWSRDFARELYSGTPVNNTAGGGRKYFYGLDTLLNTGYRDAETGVACSAADSIVVSFGNNNISTGSNPATVVRLLANVMRRLNVISTMTGMNPVNWQIAMRPTLFYELTEIWVCAYHTYRCSGIFSTSQVQSINSADLLKLRDDMRGDMNARTGQYLLIDGQKIDVILDDAIAETGNLVNGQFRSDIYIVPMTAVGGTPVTYMEYYNYDVSGGAMDVAKQFAMQDQYFTSDGGRFIWHKKPANNFCVQMLAATEPRLVCRAPYLGARITNLQYTPLMHERDAFTDSAYFVDGGKYDRLGYGPSYYSPTS